MGKTPIMDTTPNHEHPRNLRVTLLFFWLAHPVSISLSINRPIEAEHVLELVKASNPTPIILWGSRLPLHLHT